MKAILLTFLAFLPSWPAFASDDAKSPAADSAATELVGVIDFQLLDNHTVVAQLDRRSLKQKAKEAQRLIQQRARNGENVSDYLARMEKAGRHFDRGEVGRGEAILDGVLADLRSESGRLPDGGLSSGPATSEWSIPERVRIRGYDRPGDHKMELGVSADGTLLFFNNSNEKPARTDVFYATRVGADDTLFEFRGPIGNANKPDVLDATPAHDRTGTLSFVSTRVRPPALHWGTFVHGELQNVTLVPLSLPRPHYALGMEFGPDKNLVVFTFRSWRKNRLMEIAIAAWNGKRYVLLDDWREIMAAVNTDDPEYAPELSSDLLELWFTRLTPGGPPVIYSATRPSIKQPFTNVTRHPTITGLVEAPTLTGDDNTMYYHCRDMSTGTWEVCITHRR